MECSICKEEIKKQVNPETGKVFWDQGHNAEPVNSGRCCDKCNYTVVIPKRLEGLFNL
jgi:hypothetical protein